MYPPPYLLPKMVSVISQKREEPSTKRRYTKTKAEHTARMATWCLWDTARMRREKAGEMASRMEPKISKGLVIWEEGCYVLWQGLFWTTIYYRRREDGSVRECFRRIPWALALSLSIWK